jgi:L-lactate dehydrogenase complex protein LldG
MSVAAKDSRTAMLARLEAALADAPRPPRRPAAHAAFPAAPPDGEALLAAFLSNLDAAGVTHDAAKTPGEAAACLGAYLGGIGAGHVAAWDADVLQEIAGFDVHGALQACGIAVSVPSGERPCPDIAAVQAGVTGAFAALSATGTVVVTAGPGMPRSVSIVPPVHVALVPQSRLIPDLPALIAGLPPSAPLPSAIHAISGVSSTGDIEFVYVRGAHGPVAVHVIVMGWR